MGQSMQKPNRSILRSHNSRLSARSLQRSSNQSITHQKRASWSASKLPNANQEENIDSSMTPQNAHIRNGEIFIMSRYEDQPNTIKESNKLKIQRGSIGGEGSQLSPNFRQIAQTGVEYGLGPWGAVNASKQSMEVSHGDTHHDITISFSKAKNHNNSPFHEDHDERKSCLKQILEFGEESQHEKSLEPVIAPPKAANQKYLSAQIDKISATRSVYSDNFNKGSSPVHTPSDDGTPKKNKNIAKIQDKIDSKPKQTSKTQKKIQQPEPVPLQHQSENKIQLDETNALNHSLYNDYDCADFRRKIKDAQGNGKKVVKMSKKMQELKQKIASKASNSKEKEQILRGSIQRLSKSLRKYRDDHSMQSKSREQSKNKLKPILSKVQCLDIKIDSHTEIKPEGKSTKKVQPNLKVKSPKQSLIEQKNQKKKDLIHQEAYLTKIRSSEQLGQTTNPSSNSNSRMHKNSKDTPTQLLMFNGGNTYIYQNLIIANKNTNELQATSIKKIEPVRAKEPSFTQMVKKQHFGNKLKKKSGQTMAQDSLKYSQIEKGKQSPINEHFFASTCAGNKFISGQQYQFFDVRQSKKLKQSQAKISKHQTNSLKMITEQLTGKNRKSKIKVTLNEHSNNSTSQQQSSRRNLTYQEKSTSFDRLPANLTALNYTEIIGNHEEYMLRDALNRQRQGQQWAKEEKKKHKSSQHSSKMTGVKSSRLLVF